VIGHQQRAILIGKRDVGGIRPRRLSCVPGIRAGPEYLISSVPSGCETEIWLVPASATYNPCLRLADSNQLLADRPAPVQQHNQRRRRRIDGRG
jgi:hypothetical protein